MAVAVDKIFVNLPIKNLEKTMEFFGKIGFEFNAQFTSETTTCMVISDSIYVMLLEEEAFKGFTNKNIVDASNSIEAIVSLAAESRDLVDEIVNKAVEAGGKITRDPVDHGFMYQWGFDDINGHSWEVFFMDPSAVNPQ